MNFRSTPLVWVGAGLLLLSPAVAMIFTDEVAWGLEDFAALALLPRLNGLTSANIRPLIGTTKNRVREVNA